MHCFTVNSKEVGPLLTYIKAELISFNGYKRHISWIALTEAAITCFRVLSYHMTGRN